MSWLTGIIGKLGDGLVKEIGDIVDDLHTSDEERAKAAIAKATLQLRARETMQKLHNEMEQAYLDDMKNQRALAKAELASEDWWVRRSRPAASWGRVVIVLLNYFVLPLIAAFVPRVVAPVSMPEMAWVSLLALSGVYNLMRSVDKGNLRFGSRRQATG